MALPLKGFAEFMLVDRVTLEEELALELGGAGGSMPEEEDDPEPAPERVVAELAFEEVELDRERLELLLDPSDEAS